MARDVNDRIMVERVGDATRITLNRPDKRNALSADMVEMMLDAVESANSRDRAIVFRGRGPVFCAGFDFSGISAQSDADLLHRFVRIEQLLQAVWYSPCSTVALAAGACYGAGADLFASCGSRVAAPGTRFRMPGLRFGIVLGTRRLGELLGADNARSVLQASAVLDADEAARFGLVREICEAADFDDRETMLIDEAAALPDDARRALMRETRSIQGDSDLASLVRSAAVPGLRQRIEIFLGKR